MRFVKNSCNMIEKHLAIQIDGIDDIVKYEKSELTFGGEVFTHTYEDSLFTFIGQEFSKKISQTNNEHCFNLGSGHSIKNSKNTYYYVSTKIDENNNVYLFIDPDDGDGEKFIGTIDEIKSTILSILPKEYYKNELILFPYEPEY